MAILVSDVTPQPCNLAERKNNTSYKPTNSTHTSLEGFRNFHAFLEDIRHLFVYHQPQRTSKPATTRHLSLADRALRTSHSDNMARGHWIVS